MISWALSAWIAATAIAAPQSFDAVLVRDDGRVVARVLEIPAPAADLAGVDHVWLWNHESPPTRLAAAALDRALAPLPSSTLHLKIVFLEKRASKGIRVIAAPSAMWEEIPETLLPSYTLQQGTAVAILRDPIAETRVRAFSSVASSPWADVAGRAESALLALAPASEVRTTIPNAKTATLTLLARRAAADEPRPIAIWAADDHGIVCIPSAPQEPGALVLVEAERAVPRVFRGVLQSLPSKIELEPGVELTGRTLANSRTPLALAEVDAEWWAPGIGHLLHRRTHSAPDGYWTLQGVPRAEVAFVMRAPGRATQRGTVNPRDERTDLGDRILPPSVSLEVLAVDESGKPVAGARLRGIDVDVATDARGIAVLRDLAASERLTLRVSASGFETVVWKVAPPLPPRWKGVLHRGFRVRGHFIDEDGSAIAGASLKIKEGNRERSATIDSDGRFDLDLPVGAVVELIFLSPFATEVRLPVPAGQPGEVRELGDVHAARGAVVKGRVVDALDHTPIAGARVWALRQSMTPNLAFARGEHLETHSGEGGDFVLAGAAGGTPLLLRIDAAGFSRRYESVTPHLPPEASDLGDLSLSHGGTLRIAANRGDRASVDLRGDALEADTITASMINGIATFAALPAGSVHVTVMEGADVICETEAEIREQESTQARCQARRPLVRGEVTVAGAPGVGMLLWESAGPTSDSMILSRVSPGGAEQQQLFGAAPSRVTILVENGRFESRDLHEARWSVSWLPDAGGTAPARQATIDGRDEQVIAFHYGQGVIRGVVVDGDGNGVVRATVTAANTMGGTATGPDGSFVLSGLEPGSYEVRARERNRTSKALALTVRDGEETRPVRLVLDQAPGEVIVSVRRAGGEPASGALVFLETGLFTAFVSADANGKATFQLPAGGAPLRRAAFLDRGVWALGPWTESSPIELSAGESGNLRVEAGSASGPLRIVAPGNWDLSGLLLRLGIRAGVGARQPFLLQGVPVGMYSVALGNATRSVMVVRDREQTLTLP